MTLKETLDVYTDLGAVEYVTEIKNGTFDNVAVYNVKSDDLGQTLCDIAGSVAGEDATLEEYESDVARLDGTVLGVTRQALAVASGVVVGASSIVSGVLRFRKPLLYVAAMGLLGKAARVITKNPMLGGPNSTRDVFVGEFVGGKMVVSKVFSVNTSVVGLVPQIPCGVHHDDEGASVISEFLDGFTTTGHAVYAGRRLRLNKDKLCNACSALTHLEVFETWVESIESDLVSLFNDDAYLNASNKARLGHTATEHAEVFGRAIGFSYPVAIRESYGAAFLVNNYCAKVVDFYARGRIVELLNPEERFALTGYFKLLDRSAAVLARLVLLLTEGQHVPLTNEFRGMKCFPLSEKGDRIPRIGTILGEHSFGLLGRNYDAIPSGFSVAPLARRARLNWPEYAPEEVKIEESKIAASPTIQG